MTISTRLQNPWDDPNAYTDSSAKPYSRYPDPNAYNTGSTNTSPDSNDYFEPQPVGPYPTGPEPPADTKPYAPPPTGVPSIPDGGGGTVPIPPPPIPWVPWTGTKPVIKPVEEYGDLPATPDPWSDITIPGPTPATGSGTAAAPAETPAPAPAPITGGGYGGSYSVPAGGASYNAIPSGGGAQNGRANDYQSRGDRGLNDIWGQGEIKPGNDPRLLRFQNLSDEAINRIMNSPDRLGLAKSYYDIFDKETEGDYQRDLKEATNLGAARGRLGSGLLTNSYGDLFERRSSDKDTTKRRLLTDALQGTIQDRQDAYRAISDAENMAYGQGVGDREEARSERQARLGLVDRFFNERDSALDRDFQYRNEARGERQYADDLGYRSRSEERDERQYGDDLGFRGREEERADRTYGDTAAQTALLNRLNQKKFELAEKQAQWDRDYKLWEMGLGLRPKGARPAGTGAKQ